MMSVMSTRERIHPDTSLGRVELVVGDLDSMASFYEQAIGLAPISRSGSEVRLGSAEGGTLIELAGDPDAPPPPAPLDRSLPHGVPRALARRARALRATRDRRGLVVHRRVGSPRQRGALPRRSRGQRHRDLPRPAPRRVALRRRTARDGDAAARPRRRDGRARRATTSAPAPTGRASATCTCRSRRSRRRGVLRRRPRTRRHDVPLPRCPLHVGRRLPPPRRHQHLGERERPRTPARARAGCGATPSSSPMPPSATAVASQLRATGYELADVDGGVEAVDPSGNHALADDRRGRRADGRRAARARRASSSSAAA